MLELSKEKVLKNLRTFVVELKHPIKSNYLREGVLIKGDYGWAEFAPFANHSIEHSTRWLQSAIEMAWTDLVKPEKNQIEGLINDSDVYEFYLKYKKKKRKATPFIRLLFSFYLTDRIKVNEI